MHRPPRDSLARRAWADKQIAERIGILVDTDKLLTTLSVSKRPIDQELLDDILSIGVYDVEKLHGSEGKESTKLTLNPSAARRWVTAPERCVKLPSTW